MQAGQKAAKYDRKSAEVHAAAARVFATEGYDRASIREVAESAGVSVPGLYYYVRSKEELLFQIQYGVFDELVERFKAGSSRLTEPEARLELLIRNHLERFLANVEELVVCAREIDRLSGEYRTRVASKQREYFGLAVRIFSDLAERDGRAEVAPRTAALAMFGTINWIYTWYKPGSGPSAASLARELARLYLHGVVSRPRTRSRKSRRGALTTRGIANA